MNQQDISNASFAFSLNMLRMLLHMKLITEEEYNRIVIISKEYYDTDFYCV